MAANPSLPTERRDANHRARRPDDGLTVIEILLSVVLTATLVGALSAALLVALRTTPTTEDRIDDARSTRMLSTWLSQDTMSTPPFLPETSAGGFDVATAATPTNNRCGGDGTNVLHMRWTETVFAPVSYVANYRFVVEGDAARIYRLICKSENGAPYQLLTRRAITPNLDPTAVPVTDVATDATTGNVEVVAFQLVGLSGEAVRIETSSRNPSEFFP